MLKILEPIEAQHRRITQAWGSNFKYNGKWMYGEIIKAWDKHYGIDYSSRENKYGDVKNLPIRAGFSGSLELVEDKGMGNVATIIKDGYRLRYMHLSSFEGENREVLQGEIIGYTGNTGTFTTAAHLHTDLKKDGKYINQTDMMFDELDKELTAYEKWVKDENRNIFGLASVLVGSYGEMIMYKEDDMYYIKNDTNKWHLNELKESIKEGL